MEISEINLSQEIMNLDARRYRLRETYADLSNGFVIKCGPLCIVFSSQGKPSACSVESATRFADREAAEKLAGDVRNGAGERGRVVEWRVAISDALEETNMAISALKQAVQAQVA